MQSSILCNKNPKISASEQGDRCRWLVCAMLPLSPVQGGHTLWVRPPQGFRFFRLRSFVLSALVSTSDGYFNTLPFLSKRNRLELRTEGLRCVSLC